MGEVAGNDQEEVGTAGLAIVRNAPLIGTTRRELSPGPGIASEAAEAPHW